MVSTSSVLHPIYSHGVRNINLKICSHHWEIFYILGEIGGKFVTNNNIRIITSSPFNVLTSPHPHVVENCVNDLSVHGEDFDMMGLSRTPYNKINIHIGGFYGDKISSMAVSVRTLNYYPTQLVLTTYSENDDKRYVFSS